jgi:hypothetical protein
MAKLLCSKALLGVSETLSPLLALAALACSLASAAVAALASLALALTLTKACCASGLDCLFRPVLACSHLLCYEHLLIKLGLKNSFVKGKYFWIFLTKRLYNALI